nr:hypothetical protein [Tanacetum cinerariifolium]
MASLADKAILSGADNQLSARDSFSESSTGPSRKRCKSLAATMTLSIHATSALVPSRADLLLSRKRFRDFISPKDSVKEGIDTDVLEDIKANATAIKVAVVRDVVAEVDAGIDMEGTTKRIGSEGYTWGILTKNVCEAWAWDSYMIEVTIIIITGIKHGNLYKLLLVQVMAAPNISISLDVSVERVGSSFSRLILIGSSYVEVPVAPKMGAAGHSVLGHSLYGHTLPDTTVTDSSTPLTTSESSAGDSSSGSSTGPSRKRCRSPAATMTSSIQATRALVPSRADLLLSRKRFRDFISPKDSVKEGIDTDVLEDIEANATAIDVAVVRDVVAEVDAELSARDSFSESSTGPSRKRCRSFAATMTSSIHATRALVPSRADLLLSRKRFKDFISPKDSVKEGIDTDVLKDIEANATAIKVAVVRDVVAEVDAGIDMEELAEYINTSGWNRLAFYDDDDDDVDYTIKITLVLSTEEPDNSLSMGNEYLDTIPITKSGEVIKSSVEDLVPIPSESEGILDTLDDDTLYYENIEYVEASSYDSELVSLEVAKIVILKDEEIEDDNLREKMLNVHLLIANIEALKDNLTPSSDFLTKSSSTSPKSFLEETNNFDNSLPEFESFCFDLEEINSGSTTTHSDISLLDFEAFYFDDDHIEEISSGNTTTHSDISLFEFDLFIFDLSNDQFPPTNRSDFTHEEFADELAHIISPPEYDFFYFRNLLDPRELISIFNSKICENLSSITHVSLPVEDDHSPLLTYVVWIFLAYLTYPVIPLYLHSSKNEDTIFDPGIIINRFYSFKPGLSHWCGTFKKLNTHRSHLNKVRWRCCFPLASPWTNEFGVESGFRLD